MALDNNFYKLEFDNGQQYTIKYDGNFTNKDLNKLLNFGSISLTHNNSKPINIVSSKLFSIQEIEEIVIGTQTKIWRLV